ncbi:MAG TPA: D-glycero-beta-D-manno-heptose 1-phosphate adenylyltransferase [Bacteroidia bacterium]|jgi:rfaE bifunctional protein nucleotidyltransferase chain/domain|nr:D-glycero-beta-D-manno-heptose 1-phosphate adenylyltransferase [Bacteroidia bacterium]
MTYQEILKHKILSRHEIAQRANTWRMFNRKIVFTNGCFDILHQGHVDYLCKAKDLGHKLIIGLNSDASVKRQNKSPERPINNEQSRAFILAALGIVDAIVLFDEDTPYDLIKAIQPDVLVKGADYKVEEIVGYDILKASGGEVVTIELTQGFSTTALINKISATK